MSLRQRRPLAAAAALAAFVLLAGCGGVAADAGTAQQGYVGGDGSQQVVPVGQRQPAPALSGKTLGGGELDLAALRGKVVVLNVWASWCPPCRAEAPVLERVQQDLVADGGTVVGIDTRDGQDGAAARAFAANAGLTYPSLIDPDGGLLLAFRGTLPPTAVPSTLVVDRQGRIAARVIGPVTEPRLRALLEPLLAEQP